MSIPAKVQNLRYLEREILSKIFQLLHIAIKI